MLRQAKACGAAGVTTNDLEQAGFFALLDAVEAYKPDTGYKFTTYLNYPLKTRFNEAVGYRRKKREPLNHCTSLDTPIGEDLEASLVDIIPDENAEAAFEYCEYSLYIQQLRKILDECLNTLPVQQGDVIRRRYFGGESLPTIAEAYKVSKQRIQEIESRSLRNLRRHPKTRRMLAPFLFREKDKSVNYYAGGIQRFNDSGYSSVELAVERFEHHAKPPDEEPEIHKLHS